MGHREYTIDTTKTDIIIKPFTASIAVGGGGYRDYTIKYDKHLNRFYIAQENGDRAYITP